MRFVWPSQITRFRYWVYYNWGSGFRILGVEYHNKYSRNAGVISKEVHYSKLR